MEDVSGKLKFKGVEISLGDRKFVVPSLSVNQARTHWPEILDLNKGMTVDQFPTKLEVILNIIHAAISRNYPDVTAEELGELVSADNAGEVLVAICRQSGFTPVVRDSEDSSASPSQPVEDKTLLQ